MWRRWGTFIDELEKQIIIKKLLKWGNKKQNNFNIPCCILKKIKKNTCNIIIKILMIWSTVPEIHRAKHTEIGNFGSFLALLPPQKPQISKFWKMKKSATDIIILHMCTKHYNIWCTVPEIWSETDKFFYYFGSFFALSPPPDDPKHQNFEKNENPGDIFLLYIHVYHKWKNPWRYYPFT